MADEGQILTEFFRWLPNWQIGIVLAVLFILAVFRKIRLLLFVGFIIAFIWGITFFTTNRAMLAAMGGLYFSIFIGAGVFIILAMGYIFFLRPE